MNAALSRYAENVRRLQAALARLEQAAAPSGVPPLAHREWYELLQRKLVPQLTDDAYLVVAVVGGTNIGKSVIFNHIAGTRASATSPLASGTKHPVCLLPVGFSDRHDLSQVFPGFELVRWDSAEAALEETSTHRLLWRESPNTPDNLLVLDTPDVDSDARINWERADHMRRCADLLIAVLTQQKYNDAAVKEFFRHAAAEDKAVIVVFNQCLLPEDEAYSQRWLETFVRETGVRPEWVYLAPYDRRAAEDLRLPFYERRADHGEPDAPRSRRGHEPPATESTPHNLLHDLSRLRFAEVKLRALRGAVQHVLHREHGAPGYLAEISTSAGEFRSAAQLLSTHQLAEIDTWPVVPSPLLITEIRRWWQTQRSGWSAQVHGFYNILGKGLTWPVRFARDRLRGDVESPWEIYRRQEWAAILTTVERVYDKLNFVSQLGNDVLRPRLESVLTGTSRSELMRKIHEAHKAADLEATLQTMVGNELAEFRQESPRHYEFFRKLDMAAAAARPMTSVVLFVTGFAPIGHALTPIITDTALQSIAHVAGDVAGGTISAAVGDAVLSEGASTGAGFLEAKFRRMHAAFAEERAGWLAALLNEHLLGSLPEDIVQAATLPDSEPFLEVQRLLEQLRTLLAAAPEYAEAG